MTSRAILRFDSEALPPKERFAAYAALYADGVDAHELGPAFLARVTAWRLDGLTLFVRELNDVGHLRATERTQADGFDHLVITLLRSGRVEIDTGSGFAAVAENGGLIADAGRPVRNRMHGARFFTVRVPRERFRDAVGPAAHLHGLALPPERARLLVDYVERLTERLDTLDPAMAVFAVDALLALLAGALGLTRATVRPEAGPGEPARLARVRATIDQHLVEPDLDPERLAAVAGLSRATLYRLLQPHGGVRSYVQSRRLDLLLACLNDPGETRTLATLAADLGFTSEAQASRAFQRRYGIRPGRYREEGRSVVGPAPLRRAMRLLDDDMR